MKAFISPLSTMCGSVRELSNESECQLRLNEAITAGAITQEDNFVDVVA